jgi:hypothetical protein
MALTACPRCTQPWDGSQCASCGLVASYVRQASSPGPPVRVPSLSPVARPQAAPHAARPRPPGALALLAQGPAALVGAFLVGFLGAFVLAATVAWPQHDPAKLLEAGRFRDVVTVVNATSSPSADWHRIKGHALHELGELDAMLQAYQVAAAADAVDTRALTHTIDALSGDATGEQAVKTLAQWPADDEVDDAILALAADSNWQRRHRATEALVQRPSASADRKLQAQVQTAVVDVRSEICEQKLAGVKELVRLADDEKAWPWLKKGQAWSTVYAINAAVILRHRCLSEELIRRADQVLAKAERD